MERFIMILFYATILLVSTIKAVPQSGQTSTDMSVDTVNIPKDLYNVMLEVLLRETTSTNSQAFLNRLTRIETEIEFYKEKLNTINNIKAENEYLNQSITEMEIENAMIRSSLSEMGTTLNQIHASAVNSNRSSHQTVFDNIKAFNRTLKETATSIRYHHYVDKESLASSVENLKQEIQNGIQMNDQQSNKMDDIYLSYQRSVEQVLEFINQSFSDFVVRVNAKTIEILRQITSDSDTGSEIDSTLGDKYDCKDLYTKGKVEDGVYTISAGNGFSFQVFCDMTNGGWTVIQRRFNGHVSFDRDWTEYAKGFGDPSGDYWLGLDNIHSLTQNQSQRIFFNFTIQRTGNLATAIYEGFFIEGTEQKYRMHIDGQTEIYNTEMERYVTLSRGFHSHNGRQFSTRDQDNDPSSVHCSTHWRCGGYWFSYCYALGCFNGPFDGMNFNDAYANTIRRMEIKIQP